MNSTQHRLRPHRVLLLLAFAAGLLVGSVATLATDSAAGHTITDATCWQQARDANQASATPSRDYLLAQLAQCRQNAKAHTLLHACRQGGKLPLVAAGVRVKGQRATMHQRQVITRVLNTGRTFRTVRGGTVHHASRAVQLAALVAITQESTATNLRSGHGTSVGVLQLVSYHGNVAWRLVIENSAGWFYRGTTKVRTRDVAPAVIAQSVQASGHPGAYAQWTAEARRTYAVFLRPCLMASDRQRFG